MKKKLPYRFMAYFSNMSSDILTQSDIDLIQKFIKRNKISHCLDWLEDVTLCKNDLDNSVTDCLIFNFALLKN